MKFILRTLVLAAMVAASAGCIKSTKYDKTTGDIRFSPVIGLDTRSGDNSISFPQDRTFSLWAISDDSGNRYLDDVSVSYTGSRGWTPAGAPLWPYGESLKFVAYWPSTLQASCASDGTLKIGSFSIDDPSSEDNDILVTDLTKSYDKTDSIVSLRFHHALAKVDFRVAHALGSEVSVRVEKIVLRGMKTAGSYDSSEDFPWSVSGDRSDIVIFEAEGDGTDISYLTPLQLGGTYSVIPQESAASIEVTYALSSGGSGWLTGQKMSTPDVSDKHPDGYLEGWEPDRHYTYTLIIREDKISYSTAKSSWDN